LKRSATEVLRRGIDSTLANWPLIGVRLAATIVMGMLVILSIVAAIVPLLVSAGMSHFDPRNAQGAAEAIVGLVTDHWVVLLYVLLLIFAVILVILALHSFVEAGVAQVLVDAERRANRVTKPDRGVFEAFSIERWMSGARHSWWPVFWIYNIVWSVGLLFMLVPLFLTMAGMILIHEPAGRVVVGCGGILFSFLVMIPVSVVCAICVAKAIAICVGRNLGAAEASAVAWREMRADFGRHLIVGLIVYAISFGAAVVLSSMSMAVNITSQHAPMSGLAFAPVQIVGSLAQSVVSAAIGIWLLACFVALTEER
jgi:hypothetical protein